MDIVSVSSPVYGKWRQSLVDVVRFLSWRARGGWAWSMVMCRGHQVYLSVSVIFTDVEGTQVNSCLAQILHHVSRCVHSGNVNVNILATRAVN